MSARAARVAVTAAIGLLALPAGASAGTVARSGSVIVFSGHPGELNRVSVEATDGPVLLITDAGAPVAIAPDSGCTQLDPGSPGEGASCPAPAGTALAVALGDGDDRYASEDGVTVPETVGGEAGDDRIEAGAGPGGLTGGDGDDFLDAGSGNDVVHGDAGADLLRGGSGADELAGGPGEDRIDARAGGGRDVVTCNGDTGDAILQTPADTLRDCGGRPRASLRVRRQRVGSFFDDDGFEFRVRCAASCAIAWEIVPRDRSTRRRIHQRDRRLDEQSVRRDSEGFPRFLPRGWHDQHARPVGRTTRRDIAAARLLRLRLIVTVTGRNGFQTELTRDLTLRR